MEPTVTLDALTKDYGRLRALDQVSLTFGEGVTGLLGPNGAGKTTMIKALLGLVSVTGGEGRVFGLDIRRQSREIRQLVGYMPEDDCYLAGLTGIQMVRFAARLSGLEGVEALRRSHEILDFAGVKEERYREVQTYSTGMRQKLKFAQSIVHDPRLLILDEPTAGLDPEERKKMLERVHALGTRSGKTVLLSTHILHDVQQVSSAVIILARGKVLVQEALEVLNRPTEAAWSLRTHGDPAPLAERIRGAGGGEVTVSEEGLMRVARVADDFPRRLFAWAAEAGVGIKSLVPAKNSLEEIFVQAVKGDGHAHV